MTARTIQPLDRLDAATEAALRESIKRWGIVVPVVHDQHGRIIDGHQRTRIALRLGVDIPTRKMRVKSDDDATALAVSLNADRRQLTPAQRRKVIAGLLKSGHSTRAIAGAVGVSQTQVRRDAAQVSRTAHLPATTKGRDGKRYSSRRKPKPKPKPKPVEGMVFEKDTETICPTCHGSGRVPITHIGGRTK